jgi:amidophosphoribosyltransferase
MCGVVGVSTVGGDDTAQLAFFSLFALQHRGQEAAGIAVSDGRRVRMHKDTGLVTNVFTPERLAPLRGDHAIGHTRYSTTGSSVASNAQPFTVETMHGPLAVAHNGELTNAAELRAELLNRGFGLTATSDTEVLTLMLAAAGGATWEDRLARTMPAWEGAYSLTILVADRVIAVRDPWGFRPLAVGRLPRGGHAVASETCALTTVGCVDVREVEPGEIVTLHDGEIRSRRVLLPAADSGRCTFEHVYFSRPDSSFGGRSIHEVRQQLGERLAKEAPVPGADVVVGVPDSAVPAAIGFSRVSGVPFNDGFVKNRYIGRTFIEPSQQIREAGVSLKLHALAPNLAGRRVVMLDDSLVRGTTAGPLVRLVREAGATEVHVRITCPPIRHGCYMGVDMGRDGDLAAAEMTVDELCASIGADSLAFISLDGMLDAIGQSGCVGCFTGRYPVAVPVDVRVRHLFEDVTV